MQYNLATSPLVMGGGSHVAMSVASGNHLAPGYDYEFAQPSVQQKKEHSKLNVCSFLTFNKIYFITIYSPG